MMWWWCTAFLVVVSSVNSVVASVVVRISENVPLLANNCQNSKSKLEVNFKLCQL